MEKFSLLSTRFLLPGLLFILLLQPCASGFAADDGEQAAPSAVVYLPLSPKFIVNLAGKRHYLRAEVQLKLKDDATKDLIVQHNAAIRHALILTLSGHKVEDITSMDGREALRQQAADAVKATLKTYAGEEGVDDLFFTDYVAQ